VHANAVPPATGAKQHADMFRSQVASPLVVWHEIEGAMQLPLPSHES
jgi:hypothetical protein